MSQAAPAPAAPAKKGWMKTVLGGTLGLFGGAATMYATAVFDTVVKPAKPMANFAAKAEGLNVTCESRAIGQSGWWDFGDGSALEPFNPQQSTVTHTYTKPGNYNIKLTVRNFLSDENDRTVPVEVGNASASAANANNQATITVLKVEPIGANPVAPATFKVTGQIQNADKAFIDIVSPGVVPAGGMAPPNRIALSPASGIIETLIVVDKPGQHAIQLFGTKGNEVVKQAAYVNVAAPTDGSVVGYLRIIDTGVKTETRKYPVQVAIPLPGKGAGRSFEKVMASLPGYAIQDVKVASMPSKAAVNVKTVIAADAMSFKVTGDWAGSPDQAGKLAGGTDVMILLEVTGVRQTTVPPDVKTITVKLDGGRGVANLPPMPLGLTNPARTIDLELYVYRTTGERSEMTRTRLTPGRPFQQRVDWVGSKFQIGATATDKQVDVTLSRVQ